MMFFLILDNLERDNLQKLKLIKKILLPNLSSITCNTGYFSYTSSNTSFILKSFKNRNVIAVFQPHRYTRLKSLWDDFKDAFDDVNRVVVTDVYAASETPIENINGENFAKEINAEYICGNMKDVAEKLLPTLKSGDVVIGLGAGTITDLGKELKKLNEEIVKLRTGKSVSEYTAWCAEHVKEASPKLLMQGLGEVLNDTKSKTFVKNKLIAETSSALELFSAFPLIKEQN